MFVRVSHLKKRTRLLLRNLLDSVCYVTPVHRPLPVSITKVVFVCKGNICRSAFAECLLKEQIRSEAVFVDSCGLHADMQTLPPHEAVVTAKRFGLHMESHLSKNWERCDLETADLILAMEFWQYRELQKCLPHKAHNIRLLREFTPFPENLLCNIYDPYGGSIETFEKCFFQIERSLKNIYVLLKINPGKWKEL